MMVCTLKEDSTAGSMTTKRNAMAQQFYRGGV
jgi:hypothetical protein